MMRPQFQSTNPPRLPAALKATLNKGLLSYVAAASAAGVGIMTAAQPADAEVVYTPANTPIAVNIPVPIDLNNDGIADFVLSNNYRVPGRPLSCTVCSFFEDASLKATPAQPSNAIWGFTSNFRTLGNKPQRKKKEKRTVEVAAPLFWGVDAGNGPGRDFPAGQALVMDSTNAFQTLFGFFSTQTAGPWGRERRFSGPYLGLKFTVNGEVHYGWARVIVKATPLSITATLTGYAYETIPNRGILTGLTQGTLDDTAVSEASAQEGQAAEPATLGRLAQGATGLAAWRVAQEAQRSGSSATGK